MARGSKHLLFGLFVFALSVTGGGAAWAGPSLIVLEDNGASNPVEREVSERLGALVVANNLGKYYDHIDLLTGSNATVERLFERIHHRSRKRDVDVLVLSHGVPGRLLLSSGDLTAEALHSIGHLPRLRMVYLLGCHSASMLDAWRAAGARTVIGHQDVNSLPGFFFPRFLRLWGEGRPVKSAAEEAYVYSQKAAAELGPFVTDTKDYLSSIGIARSEPVISGENIDRWGRSFAVSSMRIRPLDYVEPQASHAGIYEHGEFELTLIELLNSMIPQVTISPENVPGAQELIDRTADLAWAGLGDAFPFPGDMPGAGGANANERWIDGPMLRYLLEPLREWMGDQLEIVAERVMGARLIRETNELRLNLYFDRAFSLTVKPEREAADWELYRVDVPASVRLRVSSWEGRFFVQGFDEGPEALRFKLKMPWLPDGVYLRTASLDMTDGKVQVEAGVVGNSFAVIANGQIYAKRFEGVDLWASIRRNLKLLFFPDLVFRRK